MKRQFRVYELRGLGVQGLGSKGFCTSVGEILDEKHKKHDTGVANEDLFKG